MCLLLTGHCDVYPVRAEQADSSDDSLRCLLQVGVPTVTKQRSVLFGVTDRLSLPAAACVGVPTMAVKGVVQEMSANHRWWSERHAGFGEQVGHRLLLDARESLV